MLSSAAVNAEDNAGSVTSAASSWLSEPSKSRASPSPIKVLSPGLSCPSSSSSSSPPELSTCKSPPPPPIIVLNPL
ncbi:hypothetical protein BS17DRAFT_150585 [Gyrodon lividus]|nr:hypothetical protein BS17DRAFT_150585 [Gyrodon lividus]